MSSPSPDADGAASELLARPDSGVAPRVHAGELLSTVAAVVLIPLLLLFDWYGGVGAAHSGGPTSFSAQTGWSALGAIRWAPATAIVLALGATMLRATQRGHGARTETGVPVLIAGGLASLLVGYRVLIAPPDPTAITDLKLGAPLGLLALLSIALGGWRSTREEAQRHSTFTRSSRRPRILVSRRSTG